MANTLTITKEPNDYFSFVVNGNVAEEVKNTRNDLLTVGDECHFKTANGANIIKEQQINYADITIIDGVTSLVPISVDDLFVKLISVNFFDWIFGTGSVGVSRFDELEDTFEYFGQDGKVVVVDESELKLIPVEFNNVSKSTDLTDMPSALTANKMLVVNADGDAYELKDQPATAQDYLQSVGWFYYADLETQTTPISVLSGVAKKITNDSEGVQTNFSFPPYGISKVWDFTTNQFVFDDLDTGDLINIRFDLNITTVSNTQNIQAYLKVAIGSINERLIPVLDVQDKVLGSQDYSFVTQLSIETDLDKNNPAELYILSDGNCLVKTTGFLTQIIRKQVNIVSIELEADFSDAVEKATVVDNDIFYGGNSENGFSLIKVAAERIWLYIQSKLSSMPSEINTKDFPLLVAPTTVFTIDSGKKPKAVYVNQARWFILSANNTTKNYTYTVTDNEVTLKSPGAPTGALVSIDYQ